MLKVFLVEDEVVVRNGIKNNINWSENDFIFSGETSDGELAYPMIKEIKPDIVITDIRMPFMDGLELSKLIKKEMPWIKVIILSGYEEFNYAKEAIEIGITKYLLKPISGIELLECIKDVRKIIRKEQNEKSNHAIFKKEMKEYEEDEKRRLFHNAVNKGESLLQLLERGKKLNIELSAMAYIIILLQFNIDVTDKFNKLFEGKDNVVHFDLLFGKHALLLKGSSEGEVLTVKDNYIIKIKYAMVDYKEKSYFGGVGKTVKRLGDLGDSFDGASRAFAYRYIWDNNEILDHKTIMEEHESQIHNDDLNKANIKQLDRKKVEAFLKRGSKEDITYFVEEYLNCICDEQTSSLLFRQYVIMDMYCIVCEFADELGSGIDTIDSPTWDNFKLSIQNSTSEFTKKYTERIFNQIITLRDEIASREYSNMINNSKKYIKDNFMNEDISLNQVANEVYLSPSHFSSVFSQKTNQTFIQYLTELRLNKAKELLKCTNKQISEIAYSVGYKDSHYFSYLFKKTQDCTPSQYRGKAGSGEG